MSVFKAWVPSLLDASTGHQLQPEALRMPWLNLATGEILCVQTNAKKSGGHHERITVCVGQKRET
eukprot:1471637-Amphidinium_carterae.2